MDLAAKTTLLHRHEESDEAITKYVPGGEVSDRVGTTADAEAGGESSDSNDQKTPQDLRSLGGTGGRDTVTEEEIRQLLPPGADLSKVSKRHMKRLRKEAAKRRHRHERRVLEKRKRKEKRQQAIENGEEIISGPSRKCLRRNRMCDSACQIHVAIDCSFDDVMHYQDVKSLADQIRISYSANRRAPSPIQLHITSVGGNLKARLDSLGDYNYWDMNIHSEDYLSVFGRPGKVVYLCSESDNVLRELDPAKAYIIGGLVDHNHQKGLCYRLALEKGLETAQLPIGEYLELKSRKVITVNQVFQILLQYTESRNWQDAFQTVVPTRKVTSHKQDRTEDKLDRTEVTEQKSEIMKSTQPLSTENVPIEDVNDLKTGNGTPYGEENSANDSTNEEDLILEHSVALKSNPADISDNVQNSEQPDEKLESVH